MALSFFAASRPKRALSRGAVYQTVPGERARILSINIRIRQKLEEFQHIAADKDRQLHSLFESRSALEASARIQATELDMMHEKMQMMQQELAEATMLLPESVHTTSVARAAEAVEMALETNDEETREKMEAMEAELTKMLAALHMKQAMLGFHE